MYAMADGSTGNWKSCGRLQLGYSLHLFAIEVGDKSRSGGQQSLIGSGMTLRHASRSSSKLLYLAPPRPSPMTLSILLSLSLSL